MENKPKAIGAASSWLRRLSFILFGIAAVATVLILIGAAEYLSLGYNGNGLFVLRLLDALDEMEDLILAAACLWLLGGVSRGVRSYLKARISQPEECAPDEQSCDITPI